MTYRTKSYVFYLRNLNNYGKGQVFVIRQDPKEFAMQENGDKGLLATIEKAYGRPLNYKNHYIWNVARMCWLRW